MEFTDKRELESMINISQPIKINQIDLQSRASISQSKLVSSDAAKVEFNNMYETLEDFEKYFADMAKKENN